MKVPKGWRLMRMNEAGLVDAGRQRSPHLVAGKSRPYLRVANVFDGVIDTSDVKQMPFTDDEFERFKLCPGDILLNEGQSLELVGRPAVYRGLPPNCCFQNTLVRFRAGKDTDTEFALQLFKYFLISGRFAGIAAKTTSIAHLGVSRFGGLRAAFPPIHEQRRIALILGAWDRLIGRHELLVALKAERLRALRQQLLSSTPFLSFKKTDWRTVHLAEVAENVNERNQGQFGDDKLYAVTKAEGMIPMREHVKGESQDRCKIVAQNWFAYNPMRLNIGSIARWQKKERVMVSGDYVVFRCKEEALLPDYLDHLRHSGRWIGFVKAAGNGSVRVRIYFDDLAHLSFPLPPIHEQRRIADVLNACAREIRVLEAELEALKQQKRGLMQKLLTGEIRVKTKANSK